MNISTYRSFIVLLLGFSFYGTVFAYQSGKQTEWIGLTKAVELLEDGDLKAVEESLSVSIANFSGSGDKENYLMTLLFLKTISRMNGDSAGTQTYKRRINNLLEEGPVHLSINDIEILISLLKVAANRVMFERKSFRDYIDKEAAMLEEASANIKIRAEEEIRESKIVRNLTVAISGMIMLLAVGLYQRYRFKTKVYDDQSKVKRQVEKLNEQLTEKNAELSKLNASKDRLFSIIAHDLKNPFFSIMGYTSLLKEESEIITEDQREYYLNQIERSTSKTYELLENLLHWASSQSGTLEIIREKLEAYEILVSELLLIKPQAEKKGITLYNHAPQNLFVTADKFMFSTIIRNLLTNAVKFTPSGGKITLMSSEEDDKVKIQIEDTGVGMDAEKAKKLFHNEFNNSTHGTDNEKGSGLGLLLSSDFAQKNGGSITVKSEPGNGSIFTLTLPKA